MKRHLLTGLLILLPLAISVTVAIFLLGLFTTPFLGLATVVLKKFHLFDQGFLFLSGDQAIHYGSFFLTLIILFFITLVLGALANWLLGQRLLDWGERILQRIPLVRTLYKVSREVLKTILSPDDPALKQVVLVPFPRAGTYVVGLIAREAPPEFQTFSTKELVSVLIPTTPNPTTAFLLMIPKEELILVDMKAEDALKFVVSCGLIFPPEKARK